MTARDILQSVTVEPAFDVDELATVLQALADLDRDSTACAVAMTAGGSGVECGAHAEHSEHCRVHSESASRAAELLRSQISSLG